jgi:hypothetical protein
VVGVGQTPGSAPEGSEVRPLVVKVNRRTYNIIRSIIDSSTNPKYPWNNPVSVGSVVKFVKYKILLGANVEVKAWEVIIKPLTIQKEGYELDAISISVLDGQGEVAELIVRNQFVPDEEEKYKYELVIEDTKLNANSIMEFETVSIEPDTYIPWAGSVSLADFVNKLMFFYKKAILSRFSD